MEHTKTPWLASNPGYYGDCEIYEDDPFKAKTICHVKNASDAAYIVRAVNSHEKLVDSLKETLGELIRFYHEYEEWEIPNSPCADIEKKIENAKAALALAEK